MAPSSGGAENLWNSRFNRLTAEEKQAPEREKKPIAAGGASEMAIFSSTQIQAISP